MNSELLEKILKEERKTRQKKIKEKDPNNVKDFSWVRFFTGEEFNQALAQNQTIPKKNIIDFDQVRNKEGKFIENKIKEIENDAENKQLINNNQFPIIWFKNLEKISSGSAIEKTLLPVFDPQQNTQLFSEKLDLSNYILIATSSTRDIGQLSPPLISRLDCVNVETAKPKQFFLDKYFYPILIASLFTFLILILLLIYPSDRKKRKRKINLC